MNDTKYLFGLSQIPGLGPVRIKALLQIIASPKNLWRLPQRNLDQIKLPRDVREAFTLVRDSFDLEAEYDKIIQSGITIIGLTDSTYPKLLKEIYDPPTVLFVRGSLDPVSTKIAVVGTRLMTTYGHQVTASLTEELAQGGLTVVSGLARGVDALAHRTTLQVGGVTVAVLGSGLDRIYPSENRHLAEEIVARGGAVISEYLPDQDPTAGSFPARNRIIAGLASAVVVTEAGEDSGSLITAEQALEQGRLVFAVPGSIHSKQSRGANHLISQGAKMVTSTADILDELNLTVSAQPLVEITAANQEEATILDQLSSDPVHFDDLVRSTKLRSDKLGAALTVMVISGKVRDLGGSFYARR